MVRTKLMGMTLATVLGGSLATSAVAQDQRDGVDPCAGDAVRVTGELIWKGLDHDPLVLETDTAQHIRDFVYLSRLQADDDRLDGDATAAIDWDFHGLDGRPRQHVGVNRGTFRIDAAEGSWEGPWSGIGTATDAWRAVVELTGSGAYDGLSATLFARSGDRGPVAGVIYPTQLTTCDFAIGE